MGNERVLMRGSNAIGEAAVRAGMRYYFGYPITPQNELPEYLSARLPEVGGTFIQGESEIASVNMMLGASAAGGRTMTSSSGPGISLKQEAVSYMNGMELPAVIVNMMRGGPGLGSIAPSQADYLQAVKGGGHGDFKLLVLAPAGVQEAADITYKAFDLADKYRNPVMILGDGLIGQMMEPVVLPEMIDPASLSKKDYIVDGCAGREKRVITSFYPVPQNCLEHNWTLKKKYEEMEAAEQRWETYLVDDADMVIVAYGTSSRIAKGAINTLRKKGYKIGLFRPISLWPYPRKPLRALAEKINKICVFEMSTGQMVEDVMLAVGERAEIYFHGVPGGVIPIPVEVVEFVESVIRNDGRVGRRVEI